MSESEVDPVKYMSRHLVALATYYRSHGDEGEARVAMCSGFVMELARGKYVWVTAGHSLKRLNELATSGAIHIIGGGFLDSFGDGAVSNEVIPYTYELGDAFYVNEPDECLDFAVLKLNTLLLSAFNRNGIVPIRIDNWGHELSWSDFDFYKLLGLPSSAVEVREPGLWARPAMIAVQKIGIDDLPPPPPESHSPKAHWFIGQIPDEAVRDLRSIEGMSGGPILGFGEATPLTMSWRCKAAGGGHTPSSLAAFDTLRLRCESSGKTIGMTSATNSGNCGDAVSALGCESRLTTGKGRQVVEMKNAPSDIDVTKFFTLRRLESETFVAEIRLGKPDSQYILAAVLEWKSSGTRRIWRQYCETEAEIHAAVDGHHPLENEVRQIASYRGESLLT